MTTIIFEDKGQDFLEWDVSENGIAMDCRPFQTEAWNGTAVINIEDLRYGNP